MFLTVLLPLLAGLGTLLVGMKLLSDGTGHLLNNNVREMLNKTSKSKLIGVGVGAVTTAVINSSGATTVIVVGLVNAGAMTLYQATTIIMGANIGTTITAQFAALSSFSIGDYFAAMSVVGALIFFLAKKSKTEAIGSLITGFGLLFVGLDLMKSSLGPISNNPDVLLFLSKISDPFLLLLIGIVSTVLVQSSSATTSIMIAMVAEGLMFGTGGNEMLYVILGTNIGSTATALISSLGANTNAKRASIIHLLFNTFGSIIFFIALLIWKGFAQEVLTVFGNEETQIAMFHTMFNTLCTLMFIPFTSMFVKLSKLIIKDKKVEEDITYLDRRFFNNIPVAIENASKETTHMLSKSIVLLTKSMEGFMNRDADSGKKVKGDFDKINGISKNITDYLVHLSAHITSPEDGRSVAAIHQNNAYIVRVSELADNINKYTQRTIEQNLTFSDKVKSQLTEMVQKITELSQVTIKVVLERNFDLLKEVDVLENRVDEIRRDLHSGHLERLNSGECRSENSAVFISLVANLERIGDYLSSMSYSIESL